MTAALVLVARCVSPDCPRAGQEWCIELMERVPGLVAVPRLVCTGCGCEPMAVGQPRWEGQRRPAGGA